MPYVDRMYYTMRCAVIYSRFVTSLFTSTFLYGMARAVSVHAHYLTVVVYGLLPFGQSPWIIFMSKYICNNEPDWMFIGVSMV